MYLGLLAISMLACNTDKNPNEQAFLENQQNTAKQKKPQVSKEVIKDFIQSIPSPVEISLLIKDQGATYDKTLLNSPKNAANYNTNFKRALNLGIYSTDLGYANIYDQKQDAFNYLDAVRDMAHGLNLGQFFDFSTIKRLATNSSNLDSLLLITTQNFEKINGHLQDQDRANLSALILTGGWLEALYLTCQTAKKHPDPTFKERIGEQKIILDQLLLVLDFYREDPNTQKLISELTQLQKSFENVEVTKVYKESTMKEVDGVMMVVDNSTSKINVTDEDITNIFNKTVAIRNQVIQ
jgi:hypothetical protein